MSPIATRGRRARGQVIVLAALAMVTLIGGVALVIEGGNAFAQQRGVQNGTDATANAGATVIAQRLGGAGKTDQNVFDAMQAVGTQNALDAVTGWYTDVRGQLIDYNGLVVGGIPQAAVVGSTGDGQIPPNAQGVRAAGSHRFGTSFARVMGINEFTAGADAISVAGQLNGGPFLPIVFPINIVDCEVNGDLGTSEDRWIRADPPSVPGGRPSEPEYIVPLCKTGGGSFMVLDLDDDHKTTCEDEVLNPPHVDWPDFPVFVASNNGDDCLKRMEPHLNAMHGQIVTIPICDVDCVTTGGSKAEYKIRKVAGFWLDYVSDSNNPNNSMCQEHTNEVGQTITPIAGNGSSSCIAGYFIRYVSAGPVGTGTIGTSDAIGVQLIK